MAYRNGTYIAFHAEGKTDPTASDIKYYRTLKMWHENDAVDFRFVNSHDKVAAMADSSSKAKIMGSLRQRLDNSKNMILILGSTTKNDTDFVPYEIEYAIDTCQIPIIVAYTKYSSILHPNSHRDAWPLALRQRIDNGSASAIHIAFNRNLIDTAIDRYNLNNKPKGSLIYFTKDFQKSLGVKFAS